MYLFSKIILSTFVRVNSLGLILDSHFKFTPQICRLPSIHQPNHLLYLKMLLCKLHYKSLPPVLLLSIWQAPRKSAKNCSFPHSTRRPKPHISCEGIKCFKMFVIWDRCWKVHELNSFWEQNGHWVKLARQQAIPSEHSSRAEFGWGIGLEYPRD